MTAATPAAAARSMLCCVSPKYAPAARAESRAIGATTRFGEYAVKAKLPAVTAAPIVTAGRSDRPDAPGTISTSTPSAPPMLSPAETPTMMPAVAIMTSRMRAFAVM